LSEITETAYLVICVLSTCVFEMFYMRWLSDFPHR